MKLLQQQIVKPQSQYTDDYLMFRRVALLHIVDPATGMCYCGRNPRCWDLPCRTSTNKEMDALYNNLLSDGGDKSFCRQCRRAFLAEIGAGRGGVTTALASSPVSWR